MDGINDILIIILSLALGLVGLYIFARLIVYAAAKSWYQVKRNEEETSNGEKKEEGE
jgi:hypothetical protein